MVDILCDSRYLRNGLNRSPEASGTQGLIISDMEPDSSMAMTKLTIKQFKDAYPSITLVQGHLSWWLRKWQKEGRLKIEGELKPVAEVQEGTWFIFFPDHFYDMLLNRRKDEHALTESGLWRRKKREAEVSAEETADELAEYEMGKAYVRRHGGRAVDVVKTPRLRLAASLEKKVKEGEMTVEEARAKFVETYMDSGLPGRKNVAHYIGLCQGECQGRKECSFRKGRKFVSLGK